MKKTVQKLMNTELEDKNKLVICHDDIFNSISLRKSSGLRPLSVPEVLVLLKTLEIRLRVLMYCQRNRTPKIVDEMKNQSITFLYVEIDFF